MRCVDRKYPPPSLMAYCLIGRIPVEIRDQNISWRLMSSIDKNKEIIRNAASHKCWSVCESITIFRPQHGLDLRFNTEFMLAYFFLWVMYPIWSSIKFIRAFRICRIQNNPKIPCTNVDVDERDNYNRINSKSRGFRIRRGCLSDLVPIGSFINLKMRHSWTLDAEHTDTTTEMEIGCLMAVVRGKEKMHWSRLEITFTLHNYKLARTISFFFGICSIRLAHVFQDNRLLHSLFYASFFWFRLSFGFCSTI